MQTIITGSPVNAVAKRIVIMYIMDMVDISLLSIKARTIEIYPFSFLLIHQELPCKDDTTAPNELETEAKILIGKHWILPKNCKEHSIM